MYKLLVILGPTATGKTDIALSLAKKFNGELISADSRQVYKGLDIGTGKAPSGISNDQIPISKKDMYWEIDGIKIWMYDVISPKEQYNASFFVKDAGKVIKNISKKGKLPILVGGTGLYIRSILYGLSNLGLPENKSLRKELEKLTLEELQNKLNVLSPSRFQKLNNSDKQNPRRLLRSLELESMYGHTDTNRNIEGLDKEFNILKIGLTAPREILYKYCDLRILARLNQGMIEEAEELFNKGVSLERLRQLGLEYRVLADYLEEKIEGDKLVKILEGKIHGYVRRQLTYFKKEKDVNWFDITNNFLPQVENMVAKWYDRS